MTILSLGSRISAAVLAIVLASPLAFAQAPSGLSPAIQLPMQAQVPPAVPTEMGPQTAQLWTNGISYEPADEHFSEPFIQPDLRVGYRFNYKFTFNLKARALNGKMKSVPDGWYLFTLALIAKDTSRLYKRVQPVDVYDRFVTAASPSLVLVTGGEFSVPVSLRFDGLTSTALANLLLVELLPLKEQCQYPGPLGTIERPCVRMKANGKPDPTNSDVTQLLPGFRPYLAQISFIPFKNKDGGRPLIDDDSNPLAGESLAKYVVEARKRRNIKRISEMAPKLTAEQYARKNNLYFVALNDPEMAYLSKRHLKNTTAQELISEFLDQTGVEGVTAKESQRRILSVLCDLLYRKNKQFNAAPPVPLLMGYPVHDLVRNCGYSRTPPLQLTRNTHVGKVDTTKRVYTSINPQLNYTVMNNFIVARTHSRGTTTTFTEKPLNLFKIIDSFGVGLPIEVTHSVSVSDSQSKAEMVMTNMNESMDFNPLGLVFTGVDTQSCLQVLVRPSWNSPFYDSTSGAKNGLYICAPVKASSELEEIYAHVFTHAHDSSIVRAFEPGTQTLNAVLRGDRDLSAFFFQIRSAIKPVHGPEIFPNALPALAEKLFAKPMAYPGIISSPVTFERDWNMSMMQGALMQYKETFMEEQASR